MKDGLLLAWYVHLPDVCGDDEVVELWLTSLEPMVRTHREAGVPANVALTGALLRRLALLVPQSLSMFREAIGCGALQLVGTTLHDVALPLLPLKRARLQLELDLEVKRELLGVRATLFWPGNFGWTPVLADELTRLGYATVLLDERHLDVACEVQSWHWEHRSGMTSRMLDTAVQPHERALVYRLHTDHGPLAVVFRNWSLVRQWSFGTTALLHAPWDSIDEPLAALYQHKGLAVLADDGDRINAVSLANYARVLSACRQKCLPASDLPRLSQSGPPLPYLPTFILGDIDATRGQDADARYYLALLSQLHARTSSNGVAEALELDDVFPLFWKNVSRKRWYFERLRRLLLE